MKKPILLLLSLTMVMALVFTGCASSSALKDGTYKAEFAEPDSHGWTEFVEVTVENDKITKVNFDAKNDKGDLKSADTAYKDAMVGAGSDTWPSDFYPKLAQSLIDTQDISKVDAVAGATSSSDAFKKLVESLTKNMSSGKTETVKVPQ